mmetsp:Transcript_47336/g.137903  ORF Transcript_47336/g.137903 Transcript_47336/m.137903 type:complete len:293 (+) Transcript_47336:76-954(+)
MASSGTPAAAAMRIVLRGTFLDTDGGATSARTRAVSAPAAANRGVNGTPSDEAMTNAAAVAQATPDAQQVNSGSAWSPPSHAAQRGQTAAYSKEGPGKPMSIASAMERPTAAGSFDLGPVEVDGAAPAGSQAVEEEEPEPPAAVAREHDAEGEAPAGHDQGMLGQAASPVRGIAGHDATTTCRPCSNYFYRGCALGQACPCCHEHPRTRRLRLCKSKRDRVQKLVGRYEALIAADPWGVDVNNLRLPPSFARDVNVVTDVRARVSQAVAAAQALPALAGGVAPAGVAPRRGG